MEMPNIDTIERNHSWGQTEQLQQSTHIQTLYTDYIHQWHKENKPVFSRDAQGMGPHNIAPPYERDSSNSISNHGVKLSPDSCSAVSANNWP